MKNVILVLIINLVFTFNIFGADFRNLKWGMNQQEVIALNGEPVKKTKKKVVFGTKTQTFTYKEDDYKFTYELLFLEDLLNNASYKFSSDEELSANEVSTKFGEVKKVLEEQYGEPVSDGKIDNSTKKIIYADANTKVMVVYFNLPIKEDYINRNAYLNVSYSNKDEVVKAEIKNKREERLRDMESKY